ncbi:MAG TPA: PaaI family thioesterase [Candidatus Binatia bacterium]|nr:PaaI family thioesterase [Candidatus Binatia bacterium]
MSAERPFALAALFGPAGVDLTNHTPHARCLRIAVVETGPRCAVLRLPYRPELVGDPARGVVFGGAVTTLLDQASGLAIACSLETLRPIATIDLRVDYLRAAAPGLDLYARVECYRLARDVAFVRGIAYERGPEDPFASCLGTFMLGS